MTTQPTLAREPWCMLEDCFQRVLKHTGYLPELIIMHPDVWASVVRSMPDFGRIKTDSMRDNYCSYKGIPVQTDVRNEYPVMVTVRMEVEYI